MCHVFRPRLAGRRGRLCGCAAVRVLRMCGYVRMYVDLMCACTCNMPAGIDLCREKGSSVRLCCVTSVTCM
jgi:hypothetical protein